MSDHLTAATAGAGAADATAARATRRGVLGAAALALALATGCAGLPDPSAAARLRDAQSLGWTGTAAATPVGRQWWRELGDAQLDSLMDTALAGNLSLKLAQARLARATAQADLAGAAAQGQVGASAELTRQRFTETGPYPPPLAGSERNSGTLQLGGSWELDFFGRNTAVLGAALGAAQAAQADEQAARVLLASQVVRAWVTLARLDDQRQVVQRILAQREETAALVRQRLQAGLDTRVELQQAEGALPEAAQQITALDEQISLARNALAALAGEGPAFARAMTPSLAALKLPPMPRELPADLLGARPDIVAGRWRVEAAVRDVDAARAQFYPNINLVGYAGLSSLGLSRLTDAGSLQWGFGPALRLPLFDAGRLRANLGGRNADLEAAVQSYNGAVVDALRDVADQLGSLRSAEQQISQQAATQAAAEAVQALAAQRVKAGTANRLQLLGAEAAVLQQRRLALDLRARAFEAHVGLVRALGGGWQGTPEQMAVAR